jgi:Flp pilus assembly protein TadG
MLRTSTIRWISRFARDRRGVSAVEFAFVAPVMIVLYLGCVEVSDSVAADRKVSLIANTLSNLTSSCSNSNANAGGCSNNIISATEMNNILDASSAIILPYDKSKLKMTVSCLSIDANKNVTVKWSATRNGAVRTSFAFDGSNAALAVGSSYPINLIYSEVSYAYMPAIGYIITGTLTLSDYMFTTPRNQTPAYPDAAHPCT